MAFRCDHSFDANRCPRARRPPGRGKSGNRGNTGGKGGGADPRPAQQPRPPLPPPPQMQLPSTWTQPMTLLQPTPPAWQMPPQHPPPAWQMPPPPRQQTQPPRSNPPPQWGDGYGHGDDLGTHANAGYETHGPPLNAELSPQIVLCCLTSLTSEATALDPADQYRVVRGGDAPLSNPVRTEAILESGEADNHKDGRAAAAAYYEALWQIIERGGSIEGSIVESAYKKGFIRPEDWGDERRAPSKMLEAVDAIAKKVADGRTIALGCTCPMDGGACHRNVLRRVILRAAERKRREIDSRQYERTRQRRSRSRSPPRYGEQRFGERRPRTPPRFGGQRG